MGFEIEASHHEVAEGQHEIDFKYDEVLPTADNVMTFKYVVKTYAQQHGLHATFMPKPIFGINGSVCIRICLCLKMAKTHFMMKPMSTTSAPPPISYRGYHGTYQEHDRHHQSVGQFL